VTDQLTALVVEDDFRVADLHAGYVDRVDGFTAVGTARSCVETVRRLTTADSERVDLLLIDNYLPDGNGIDLATSIAVRQSGADVLMVTADDSGRSIRRAIAAGAVNYLVKPFEFSRLAEMLGGYREYRSLLAREHCAQDRIDRALRALHPSGLTSSPRSALSLTGSRIVDLLDETPDDLSAQELAGRAGIARATAQRYLAQLADAGVVEVFLRYGATGRPEHRYRLQRR
jgi:two-component system CitB family response regulator